MGAGFPLLAHASYWSIPGFYLFLLIHITGIALFGYIAYRRIAPLLLAQTDIRFDRPLERLARVFKYWFAQWRHPRYPAAGVLHILLFAGFLILVIRAFAVLGLGFSSTPVDAESSMAGLLYGYATNYAATVVFGCVLVAIFRRLVLRPVRYEVPPQRGQSHKADAVFLLALIGILMLADSFFEASQQSESLAFLSMPWLLQRTLSASSEVTLSLVYRYSYLLHVVTFYLPALLSAFRDRVSRRDFAVQYLLREIGSAGHKAGEVGSSRREPGSDSSRSASRHSRISPGSTSWISIRAPIAAAVRTNAPQTPWAGRFRRGSSPSKRRDYVFRHYPVFGAAANGEPLIGGIYSEDEIWSCTTCGACEAECPLLIEYIDKIVDLRRGLVDDGKVPQSLQKPLKALESRGNPYGKMEKKRADWAKAQGLQETCNVKVGAAKSADTLVLRRQHHLLRRPDSVDWPRHGREF